MRRAAVETARKAFGREGRGLVLSGPPRSFAASLGFLLTLLVLSPIRLFGDEAQAVDSSPVTIKVRDATPPNDPVPNFTWMVTLDNSHDQASVTPPATYSPVVETGEVTDDSGEVDVSLLDTVAPDRGYLVSVLVNDGTSDFADKYPTDYKIGGAHFTMPDDDGEVVVELQAHPLPLATVRVRAFHDNQMVNSEDDIPLEDGLGGFHVTLADRVGEVTTDWFGNPICTEYEDLNGSGIFDEGDYGPDGPVPVPGTGGFCHPGPDGIASRSRC